MRKKNNEYKNNNIKIKGILFLLLEVFSSDEIKNLQNLEVAELILNKLICNKLERAFRSIILLLKIMLNLLVF